MKKKLMLPALLLLASCLLSALLACQSGDGTDTTAAITAAPTEPVTEAPTDGATSEEETTEEETTLRELTWETYDPALDQSTVDPNAVHTVDQSQWIVQDGLDRIVSTNTQTGDIREDKIVAIFYWTWHGDFGDKQTAYNLNVGLHQ